MFLFFFISFKKNRHYLINNSVSNYYHNNISNCNVSWSHKHKELPLIIQSAKKQKKFGTNISKYNNSSSIFTYLNPHSKSS